MQSVSSRIWTRVAVFISYDDNDYTTGTSGVVKVWILTLLYKSAYMHICTAYMMLVEKVLILSQIWNLSHNFAFVWALAAKKLSKKSDFLFLVF